MRRQNCVDKKKSFYDSRLRHQSKRRIAVAVRLALRPRLAFCWQIGLLLVLHEQAEPLVLRKQLHLAPRPVLQSERLVAPRPLVWVWRKGGGWLGVLRGAVPPLTSVPPRYFVSLTRFLSSL